MKSPCHGYFQGRLLQISMKIPLGCLRVDPDNNSMEQSSLKMRLLSTEPVLIIKISVCQAHSHLPKHASVNRNCASLMSRSFHVRPQGTFTSFYLTLPLPYLNLPSSSSTYPHIPSLTVTHLPYSSLT